jgi:hypothetical protein
MNLDITKDISVRQLNYLSELDCNVYKEINLEIRKSNSYQPGILASLIQFLITNINLNPNITINILLSEDETSDKLIDEYFEYYHLLVLILYKKNSKLHFSKLNIDIHELFGKYIKKLKVQEDLYAIDFDKTDYLPESRKKELQILRNKTFATKSKNKNAIGISFMIPCFDHLKRDRLNTSYYFYNNTGFKSSEDIETWLSKLFAFNNVDLKKELLEKDNLVNNLAIVIKELFENTSDWARTNFDDTETINPSFRGCLLNIYLEPTLKKDMDDYDHINEYLKLIYESDQSLIESPNRQSKLFNQGKIGFIEISILDTGPGMPRRKLERDYNKIKDADEEKVIKECFNKYITSDKTGKKKIRGRGLTKVLSLIGKTGFIRTRTGHVYLRRNFFKQNLDDQEIDNKNILFDCEFHPRAEGNLITILYPFIY